MPTLRHRQCHPVQPSATAPLHGVRRWLVALAATAAICLAGNALAAPASTERSKQKSAVEAERAALRQKLSALKRDINQTESAKDHAADALADAEQAISEASRSLRELGDEQTQTQNKLAQLSKEQLQLSKTAETQQQQLATSLRAQYVAGNEDRIKLLLSGDNPNRINRDMQYLGYVSQAQAKLVDALRSNLQAVDSNRAATQNAKDELDEIAQEERDQKIVLEKEKAKRATLLAQLSSKLVGQRNEAGSMQRDERRLAGLVDKLALLIEQQKKADAAALAKRRQEQALARAKDEREKRRAQQAAASTKTPVPVGKGKNPDAIDADEAPPTKLAKNELVPDASVQDGVFARMRGQLRLPVRGELIAKYGSKRGDGPSWKGLFIRAAEGSEIKAVAGGRVIFAEWLRGFGNLIIIDHGSQYMTIYGNNQTIFKRPGDAIKAGDVIASAGNSGGNEQSGLYFEMRHQGRAFDPLGWVTIR